MKKDQLSAGCLEIGFEGGLGEEVTAHAGVALLVEVGRRSGVIAAADRSLPAKKNPKGLTQGRWSPALGRAGEAGARSARAHHYSLWLEHRLAPWLAASSSSTQPPRTTCHHARWRMCGFGERTPSDMT